MDYMQRAALQEKLSKEADDKSQHEMLDATVRAFIDAGEDGVKSLVNLVDNLMVTIGLTDAKAPVDKWPICYVIVRAMAKAHCAGIAQDAVIKGTVERWIE